MLFDREKIASRISDVQSSIDRLLEYASLNSEEFLSSDEKTGASKYYLIVMIEGCFAICTHIAARVFHKVPESYADCFRILSKENIVSENLAQGLSKMAGFRNLLIHRYWEVDDTKVHQYIKTDLLTVQHFLEIIKERYLRIQSLNNHLK